jgi:hypothetical protein
VKAGVVGAFGAVATAVTLAGCGTTREQDWPIAERWPVSQNASPECLSAARRATKYCLDKALNTDIYGVYTSECTKAQWDYARHC